MITSARACSLCKAKNRPLITHDRSRTLTIGDRKGQYPGMLQSRQFTVVLPDGTTKTVSYEGKAVTVVMK